MISANVYLASPLFNEAELRYNKYVATELEKAGLDVFLPQEDESKPKADEVTAKDLWRIYRNDIEMLECADIVVAICDGADMDSGTAFEVGYAKAKCIPIFCLRTDIRKQNKSEFINLMIQQAAEDTYFSVQSLIFGLNDYFDDRDE